MRNENFLVDFFFFEGLKIHFFYCVGSDLGRKITEAAVRHWHRFLHHMWMRRDEVYYVAAPSMPAYDQPK